MSQNLTGGTSAPKNSHLKAEREQYVSVWQDKWL